MALAKSRSHIANLLRLLGLPSHQFALMVENDQLSAGHARVLAQRRRSSVIGRD